MAGGQDDRPGLAEAALPTGGQPPGLVGLQVRIAGGDGVGCEGGGADEVLEVQLTHAALQLQPQLVTVVAGPGHQQARLGIEETLLQPAVAGLAQARRLDAGPGLDGQGRSSPPGRGDETFGPTLLDADVGGGQDDRLTVLLQRRTAVERAERRLAAELDRDRAAVAAQQGADNGLGGLRRKPTGRGVRAFDGLVALARAGGVMRGPESPAPSAGPGRVRSVRRVRPESHAHARPRSRPMEWAGVRSRGCRRGSSRPWR